MEILYRLKGNESLLLDDPEKVWVVKFAIISLFATFVKNENHVAAPAASSSVSPTQLRKQKKRLDPLLERRQRDN